MANAQQLHRRIVPAVCVPCGATYRSYRSVYAKAINLLESTASGNCVRNMIYNYRV